MTKNINFGLNRVKETRVIRSNTLYRERYFIGTCTYVCLPAIKLGIQGDNFSYSYWILFFLFLFQCHHMSEVGFAVLPPGHGRSVTDF